MDNRSKVRIHNPGFFQSFTFISEREAGLVQTVITLTDSHRFFFFFLFLLSIRILVLSWIPRAKTFNSTRSHQQSRWPNSIGVVLRSLYISHPSSESSGRRVFIVLISFRDIFFFSLLL